MVNIEHPTDSVDPQPSIAPTREGATDEISYVEAIEADSSDMQCLHSAVADSEASQAGLETPRGRLKRRRILSHSPTRADSPSRGHDRASGSRHRHHHRKHHRASSSRSMPHSPSSTSSPVPLGLAKGGRRRRSDAEPDHTLRGRARNRSGSRSRSPILEGDDEEREMTRGIRRRSQPPSRGWLVSSGRKGDWEGEMRRQRSYPNLYCEGRQLGGGKAGREVGIEVWDGEDTQGVKNNALAVQEV